MKKLIMMMFVVFVLCMGTVLGADFNITSKKPIISNVTLSDLKMYEFNVVLSDPDGDANCSWYLENELLRDGTSLVLTPSGYFEGDGYSLSVNCSDGMTNKSQSWVLNIKEDNYSGLVLFAIFILVGLLTYVGLYKRKETVIATGIWLVMGVTTYVFTQSVIGEVVAMITILIFVLEITRFLGKKAIDKR